MNTDILKRLISVAAIVSFSVTGTAFAEENKISDSVLYYGQIENIISDNDGNISSLRMSSEAYGEYVMHLSDETAFIDSGKKTASDPKTLTKGEDVYVFHSAMIMESYPPQTAAYAVISNTPQDTGCAKYMKVDFAEKKDGVINITADNENIKIIADKDTTFSDYGSDNAVTADDIQKGSRIAVWHNSNSRAVEHIMLISEADKSVTRGEFIQALYKSAGSPDFSKEAVFSDVKSGTDVSKAVSWAAEKGIAHGIEKDVFGTDEPITLEQAVTILWRYCGSPILMDYTGLTQYTDAEDISDYCLQAMLWAHEKGMLNGDTDILNPNGVITAKAAENLINSLTEEIPVSKTVVENGSSVK